MMPTRVSFPGLGGILSLISGVYPSCLSALEARVTAISSAGWGGIPNS